MARGMFSKAEKDLEAIPGMRLPICLCLDVSGSMNDNDNIDKLNLGIQKFYQALNEDEITHFTAEVSIVIFGGNSEVQTLRDFSRIEIQGNPPVLQASGLTPIGEAVNRGLDLLEQRKEQYRTYGNTFYRPWLIIMSDGLPTGDADELARAKQRVHEYAEKKKVVPIAVPIGKLGADAIKHMQELGNGNCIALNDKKFTEFFLWLHQSVSASAGADVDLLLDDLLQQATDWSEEDFLNL